MKSKMANTYLQNTLKTVKYQIENTKLKHDLTNSADLRWDWDSFLQHCDHDYGDGDCCGDGDCHGDGVHGDAVVHDGDGDLDEKHIGQRV